MSIVGVRENRLRCELIVRERSARIVVDVGKDSGTEIAEVTVAVTDAFITLIVLFTPSVEPFE
jgi:hypothetical protein